MGSVTEPINLMHHIGPEEIINSIELQNRIKAAGGNSVYGRQFVRRKAAEQGIWRSQYLVLPGGGRLFCRLALRNGNSFVNKLLPILDEFRPGVARAARAIIDEGAILSDRAELLLASPVIPENSSYPFFRDEALALKDLGVG